MKTYLFDYAQATEYPPGAPVKKNGTFVEFEQWQADELPFVAVADYRLAVSSSSGNVGLGTGLAIAL